MVTKLSDIATLHSGIVLSRKEATSNENPSTIKYKRLNLRAVNSTGNINPSELDMLTTQEELKPSQLTQYGDIVIRLFTPMFPTIISESDVGLVVPSQLALIRLRDQKVLPAYLQMCLSRQSITETFLTRENSTHRSITMKALSDLCIPLVSTENQQKIIKIYNLSKQRTQLYQELIEQEQLQIESVIESLLGGVQK